MEKFHLRIFQGQVLDQCEYLLGAASGLNRSLVEGDAASVFFNLQNLLNAGANISKMLWGQGGRRSEDRRPLRQSINVADDSPLRDVTMRNNFEHMDERIDRWWAKSASRNHVDKIIGPLGVIAGAEPIDMFRMFDPTTTNVIFWGQSFNVQAIVDEVLRILPGLKAEAFRPHWEE